MAEIPGGIGHARLCECVCACGLVHVVGVLHTRPAPGLLCCRCVAMLANLYNSPAPPEAATGSAAIGSSEAIMLAGERCAGRAAEQAAR